MKILVTGGLGYIGSHTTVELIKNNFEVVIVDNLSNSEFFILENIKQITGVSPKFYNLDLLDFKKFDQIVKENKIHGIIHFAAFKSVSESVLHPVKYYENNIISLLNVLRAMNLNGISNLVFSSSCTVYGQPDTLPVSEDSPFKMAESPYAYSKQVSENIIKDVSSSSDKLNAISLRYFNPVGAHSSGLIGELPLGVPDNLVPYITQTAAGIREELSVFGNDYTTKDGTAIRDYIHIEDLARAHVKAISKILSCNSQLYDYINVGTGIGHSVLEVINSFEKVNNLKLNYSFKERRNGDIKEIYSDVKKSEEVLGWKAVFSLNEMMKSAWVWQKNIKNFRNIS